MESYIMETFKGGTLTEGMLVGIGNPLLDISATVDDALLDKYGLKPNDAVMAEKKHWPLYQELTLKYKTEYLAGGSVQNSIRVAQWILKKPRTCAYFGSVGNDNFAKILKDKAEGDGVKVLYQVNSRKPTGTCAVLLTAGGTNRSLCANLAAAQLFTADFLERKESQNVLHNAKVFYTSGFFLAVSPESMMMMAKLAFEKNLLFVLNVSAPFVMTVFKKELEAVLPYVDILFGNDSEAEAFATSFNLKSRDVQGIALELAAFPKKNTSLSRVVVVTQGKDPIILVDDGKVQLMPVKQLSKEQIVDTNGAGDAFTGGFLSQLVLGRPMKVCIQCGMYASSYIIGQSGCSFAGPSDFKPEL